MLNSINFSKLWIVSFQKSLTNQTPKNETLKKSIIWKNKMNEGENKNKK